MQGAIKTLRGARRRQPKTTSLVSRFTSPLIIAIVIDCMGRGVGLRQIISLPTKLSTDICN
ncbi:hypothetical protein BDV26DRAFT_257146 [Aspergillus bertholletiae]|uniref:Uncharacterized protein n=1 Tax=Aspergillus bertholletiae TaxID=1226010 RepID=A0A5N7BFG7_9EURO|nr:hypothetical protein BDV26DRAFT_257146 [Aspergillus bertholletiae]